MTKRNDNEVTAASLQENMEERFAHMYINDTYNGKYAGEFTFLEEVLADEIRECETDEDRQAREVTAACLLGIVERHRSDTHGGGCGDSRTERGVASNVPGQLTGGSPSNPVPLPSPPMLDESPVIPRPGGYDGGLTIGWMGTWNPLFSTLLATLEAAKEQAQKDRSKHVKIDLYGYEVIVDPSGGTVGNGKSKNVWHYKIHAFGVTFLIHRNPNNTQQVRATYGAEALALNPLPVLHAHVLEFLTTLGLTITKETLSRVDMQVMIAENMLEFLVPILRRQAVQKARKSAIYLWSGIPETFRAGSIDGVQVCIYDKRAQMRRKMSPVQEAYMVKYCIGDDWYNSGRPITRIEFRLGRDALKGFNIHSVADLLKSERGTIDLLTAKWFRLLDKEKVAGRGTRAKIHRLWEKVRALFFEHFTGNERKDVQYRKPSPVSCEPVMSKAQSGGMIANAILVEKGKSSPDEVERYLNDWARAAKYEISRKVNERAESIGIIKGVLLGTNNAPVEQLRQQAIERFDNPTLRWKRE